MGHQCRECHEDCDCSEESDSNLCCRSCSYCDQELKREDYRLDDLFANGPEDY